MKRARKPNVSFCTGSFPHSSSLIILLYHSPSKTFTNEGCDLKNDAEFVHSTLLVPLCGPCHNLVEEAKKTKVTDINENDSSNTPSSSSDSSGPPPPKKINDKFCQWCGWGDGNELFLCESCSNTCCTDCVARNFGEKESQRVRALDVWQCYSCNPTTELKKIQVNKETAVSLLILQSPAFI